MTTVVVGAGISGLVYAYALSRRGREVMLLEESDRVGGAIRTQKRDGFLLELGPNTVRPTAQLWDLIVELGLEKEALLADSRAPRFVDFGGRLHAVPTSPVALAATRLLSVRGKLRLLGEPFIRAAPGVEESVQSFFARRLGPEVAERLAAPFVSGIFAGDATRLSASGCFPMLARWERQHGSLLAGALAALRGPRDRRAPVRGLLSFRDGLETLPRALAVGLGNILKTGIRVERLARSADTWTLRTTHGEISARDVVLATPAHRAAQLIEDLAPAAARALRDIAHPPLAVVHLAWPEHAFPAPLRGFGHLVAPQAGRRILGAVYSSSLFADRAPRGETLVTVFVGGARDPEGARLPDEEVADLAARDLAAALGVGGRPRIVSVTRYQEALPQYDLGHESRMALLEQAESSWRGLSLLGNYRAGVSVGDVVHNAAALARAS